MTAGGLTAEQALHRAISATHGKSWRWRTRKIMEALAEAGFEVVPSGSSEQLGLGPDRTRPLSPNEALRITSWLYDEAPDWIVPRLRELSASGSSEDRTAAIDRFGEHLANERARRRCPTCGGTGPDVTDRVGDYGGDVFEARCGDEWHDQFSSQVPGQRKGEAMNDCDGGMTCTAEAHIEGCYTGEGYPGTKREVPGQREALEALERLYEAIQPFDGSMPDSTNVALVAGQVYWTLHDALSRPKAPDTEDG